ncbi:MAG: cysteine synthase family protein [Candidatus Nanoarchaeia archaeon]|nr:cysteine synthase family protein [Candidatus Nanoarchaeia archaeon]
MNVSESVLHAIGNTPLIRINKLINNSKVSVFAKFEGSNPTGSIKDRIALKMIEQAEVEGKLTKDKTIIEATSGNTGISLSMIGAVKGYKVEIIMSGAVSIERQKMIQAFGSKITLTPKELGTDGARMKLKELMEKNPGKYFTTDQFSNKYNKLAHYASTGKEIWEQMDGKIDYLVCALGTSGTIMGVGKYLKEKNPDIKIVSAHPIKGHYIQGLKNMKEALVPGLYDESMIDETIMIESEKAFETARRIAKEEGIFAGMSSGAAMLAAIKLCEKIDSGNVVVIFPDRGEKYLSADLFRI